MARVSAIGVGLEAGPSPAVGVDPEQAAMKMAALVTSERRPTSVRARLLGVSGVTGHPFVKVILDEARAHDSCRAPRIGQRDIS